AFPTIPLALTLNTGLYQLFPKPRRAHGPAELPEQGARSPRALGDRGLPAASPARVERRRRLRRASVDVRGGPRSRRRLRESGWATRYEPNAVVDHVGAASTRQAFGDELAPVWQRSTYGFMTRRLGMGRTRTFAFVNLVGQGA